MTYTQHDPKTFKWLVGSFYYVHTNKQIDIYEKRENSGWWHLFQGVSYSNTHNVEGRLFLTLIKERENNELDRI